MRIVVATQYWRPYRSGLTLMEAEVAEALAAAGHEVTAVAGRHEPSLAPRERVGGVDVVRVPVRLRVDRALVAPGLVPAVARAVRGADALVLPLPLPEAAVLARLAPRGRLLVHYHCDAELERPGPLPRAARAALDASARIALRRAAAVTVTSRDYAGASRVVTPYAARAVEIPPMLGGLPEPAPDAAMEARMPPRPVLRVGALGRLTHEKGVDRLIEAVAGLDVPAEVVLAGDSAGVAGTGLWPVLEEQARRAGVAVRYLGPLADDEVAPYLTALDVLALPSVNALEAWGRVQAEAMLCGTPVVASALPGVRTLVRQTGMGRLFEPGDAAGLRRALADVAAEGERLVLSRDEVVARLGLADALERHVGAVLAVARGQSASGAT